MTTTNPRFKIAICGSGIAGLTFAVAISKYTDIEVEIYEAASTFSPVGAGIGVWPRAWHILRQLGLEDLVSKASCPLSSESVHSFALRKSDQLQGFHFYDMITKGPLLSFHRPDLQACLVNHLPSHLSIQYSKRLRTYCRLPSGRLEVSFEDNSTTICDILVGADGIKSVVRQKFLQDLSRRASMEGKPGVAEDLMNAADPCWSGIIAYRALIPVEDLPNISVAKSATLYIGKNATVTAYPVANGALLNVGAFYKKHLPSGPPFDGPWSAETEAEELLDIFSHWEPEVLELLQRIKRPKKWLIYTVKDLACFASDGVVLLGDAAHAMLPFQGSGAGQAIEDAYVLATLLGHPVTTVKSLPRVFSIYDSLRRPFATDIAQRSLLNGQYFTLSHEAFKIDARSIDELQIKLKEMGDAISKNWEWAWLTSVNDTIEQGVRTLEGAEI